MTLVGQHRGAGRALWDAIDRVGESEPEPIAIVPASGLSPSASMISSTAVGLW